MKIGFIGAGKAAFSVGKHLTEHGISIGGYYCPVANEAEDAAKFTDSIVYKSPKELAKDCDALCFAVPDGEISHAFDDAKKYIREGSYVVHLSGSLDSGELGGAGELGLFAYSIHPMIAMSDKYGSYRDLEGAFLSVEGDAQRIDGVKRWLEELGHNVARICAGDKTKYHAAAVMASNLYVGLFDTAARLLEDCGFSADEARAALGPLAAKNAANVARVGAAEALTGPVERGDFKTVRKHMSVLSQEQRDIYKELSKAALRVAKEKNKGRDYGKTEEVLYEKDSLAL